jgi:hypothetical protein
LNAISWFQNLPFKFQLAPLHNGWRFYKPDVNGGGHDEGWYDEGSKEGVNGGFHSSRGGFHSSYGQTVTGGSGGFHDPVMAMERTAPYEKRRGAVQVAKIQLTHRLKALGCNS